MKKIFTALVIMAGGFLSVSAQAPKGMGKNDPDAKKILDAVSTKFKTFKTVQGKFSLKIENAAYNQIGLPIFN